MESKYEQLFGDDPELMTIDQCEAMRELDDSQLFLRPNPPPQPRPPPPPVIAELNMVDVEVKTVSSSASLVSSSSDSSTVKRKRGRPPRIQSGTSQPKSKAVSAVPSAVDDEEDVCFICFDGGSLVLCDRRGCPKAYHPSCIKRDEAFFKSKAKWNCGWHICSSCQKASHYMCYTCTYSLCKGCTKGADYVCIRGNKGLCGTCMRTIMLIENIKQGNTETVLVDFDDKTSWEYLFKIYWVFLKAKLGLTIDELTNAKNPWKGDELPRARNSWKGYGSMVAPTKIPVSSVAVHHDEKGPCLDYCSVNVKDSDFKRRKTMGRPEVNEQNSLVTEKPAVDKVTPLPEGTQWATKELLDLVSHMRNGDTSMVSQFDAQNLLLEYIKRNNLRDPRQKSQIICDARLLNLFGKPRVAHIEMLKLLEDQFLIKEKSSVNDIVRAGVTEVTGSQLEAAGSSDSQMVVGNDRRRKTRKKMDEKGQQVSINPDEYAAIDVHNINLLYLKRNLVENLIDDIEKFHEKVVGSFVRIKIPGGDQKLDMYRLVQVVGTTKVAESYKVGSKTTDIMLVILNLDRKEVVSIEGISNQEFSEDECRRLRQTIKCGLFKRFKAVEIQEKALTLVPVKVSELLEAEISKLNHLRDLANEKGHRKDLRECVEKLDLLKSPKERQRRMLEIPIVHIDPNMDPRYESEEDVRGSAEMKQGEQLKPKYSSTAQAHQRASESKWDQGGGGTVGLNNQNTSKKQLNLTGLAPYDLNSLAISNESHPGVASAVLQSSLPSDDLELERHWHYQDPHGKVQGPFAMSQLRKWSASGLFPPELKVWRLDEKQEDSILLTDALLGRFFKKPLQPCNSHSSSQETEAASYNVNEKSGRSQKTDATPAHKGGTISIHANSSDELTKNNGLGAHSSTWTKPVEVALTNVGQSQSSLQRWELPQSSKPYETPLSQPREGHKDEKLNSHPNNAGGNSQKAAEGPTNITETGAQRVDSEGHSVQSSVQNWRPQPLDGSSSGWNTNSGFFPTTKCTEQPEQNNKVVVSEVPCSSSKQNQEELKGQAENKLVVSSNPPVQNSGPSWSTSGLIIGGQLPEVAGDWGGYSSAPTKPSAGEWDPNLISVASLKPTGGAGDHTATPTSCTDKLTNSSSHPAIDTPFLTLVPEPSEFCTLADESVSDLLAEVEAMESLGLPSPTSKMSCGGELTPGSDNDCFSPIEQFSPALDPGKSDALSSTADIQMPSQLTAASVLLRLSLMPSHPTIADEPLAVSQVPSQLALADKSHQLSQIPSHSTVADQPHQASQVHSQSGISEEPHGLWQTDARDSRKSLSSQSSSSAEGESGTKPSDVSVNQWDTPSEIQSLASSTVNQGEAGIDIQASTPSTIGQLEAGSDAQQPASSTADVRRGNVKESVKFNLNHGGVSQGSSNTVWGSNHGSVQQQASTASATSTGNPGSWGNQSRYDQPRYGGDNRYSSQGEHRYSGHKDQYSGHKDHRNYYQNRDSGYSRDRSSWNRQPSYGNGSGSFKSSGKGQRVCKFYESGHCKKGASCSYLHP